MMQECLLESRNKCDIWVDYQIVCAALQEAEELRSSNWEEISYLLDRVALLESILKKLSIDVPE